MRASHDARLLSSEAARAVELEGEARNACRALHARLSSFMNKWVPSGAEAEKHTILARLKNIADGVPEEEAA